MDRTSLIIASLAAVAAFMPVVGMVAGNWSWQLRAVVVVWATGFVWMNYAAAVDTLGYPVQAKLPQDFHLIWGIIEEPMNDNPGSITIWYRLDTEAPPKAVVMPYSRPLHEAVQKAKDKAAAGQDVFVHQRGGKEGKATGDQAHDDAPFDFVPPPSTAPEKGR